MELAIIIIRPNGFERGKGNGSSFSEAGWLPDSEPGNETRSQAHAAFEQAAFRSPLQTSNSAFPKHAALSHAPTWRPVGRRKGVLF